ncbi:MAG: DedA family protein [Candidatus Portnoybacteria bacterium]|nr:DedA family protein [Candidatus Portnoybacteria bacterium]MDD4982561.1 DedA family protein [Candidatus Portnoybacteria bacterium]
MVSAILAWLSSIIISVISGTGYLGVFLLMALESACVPVPSEIIMLFSGFLVWSGRFELWPVVIWGALGNLAGSILAYIIGAKGGRRLVEKYGKYFLVSRRDLDLADNWFAEYGQAAVFFSRLLPVVRTFISLPAGIARMDFKKFCIYTLAGSLPWSFFLAYAGLAAGENWDGLKIYFHKFNLFIGALIILGAIWWVNRHFNQKTVN